MFHYILRTFILKRKEIPAKLPLGPPPWPPPFIAVPFYELTDTLDPPPFFSVENYWIVLFLFSFILSSSSNIPSIQVIHVSLESQV